MNTTYVYKDVCADDNLASDVYVRVFTFSLLALSQLSACHGDFDTFLSKTKWETRSSFAFRINLSSILKTSILLIGQVQPVVIPDIPRNLLDSLFIALYTQSTIRQNTNDGYHVANNHGHRPPCVRRCLVREESLRSDYISSRPSDVVESEEEDFLGVACDVGLVDGDERHIRSPICVQDIEANQLACEVRARERVADDGSYKR